MVTAGVPGAGWLARAQHTTARGRTPAHGQAAAARSGRHRVGRRRRHARAVVAAGGPMGRPRRSRGRGSHPQAPQRRCRATWDRQHHVRSGFCGDRTNRAARGPEEAERGRPWAQTAVAQDSGRPHGRVDGQAPGLERERELNFTRGQHDLIRRPGYSNINRQHSPHTDYLHTRNKPLPVTPPQPRPSEFAMRDRTTFVLRLF